MLFFPKGGLRYSVRHSQEDVPQVQGSVMDDLLNDGDAMPNIDELMKYINKDGIVLSIDDILWRERYILPAVSDHSAITESPPPLPPVDPRVVSASSAVASATESYANPLLEELTRRVTAGMSPREVVVIHRDVLDDESPREERVSLPAVSESVVDDGVVCDVDRGVCVNDRGGVASSVDGDVSARVDHSNVSAGVDHINASSEMGRNNASSDISCTNAPDININPLPNTNYINPLPNTNQDNTPSRPTRTPRVTVRSAKERIVKSKTTIDESSATASEETEKEAPFEFPYSSADYVDVSQCMIDRMNQGDFDKNPVNQNVNAFPL